MDVINSTSGDKLLNFVNYRREWSKALRKSNVAPFTLRDLRKTGATMMLRNGANLKTISKLLSHTDISTTQRYLVASEEDRREAIIKLNTLYSYKEPGVVTTVAI